MPGLYTHTERLTTLSESQYNTDHENHITNATPGKMDDYSADATEMQQQTDPGELGSEVLAQSLAGELERIRFVIAEMKGTTNWYEPSGALGATSGVSTVFFQSSVPTGWTFLSAIADRVFRTATVVTNGGATGGTWTVAGLTGLNHSHVHTLAVADTGGTTAAGGSQYTTPVAGSHGHVVAGSLSFSGTLTGFSGGSWRPQYVDALPCSKD